MSIEGVSVQATIYDRNRSTIRVMSHFYYLRHIASLNQGLIITLTCSSRKMGAACTKIFWNILVFFKNPTGA